MRLQILIIHSVDIRAGDGQQVFHTHTSGCALSEAARPKKFTSRARDKEVPREERRDQELAQCTDGSMRYRPWMDRVAHGDNAPEIESI